MIGIDTNVLVRYILQDDKKQSQQSTRFIESHCSDEEPAFINGVTICELVWVLESAYDYSRRDIAKVIECILGIRQFHIHQPEILWQALHGYQKDGADFADNYIGYLNYANHCQHTITFDKKAAKLTHFKLLEC